ncbi:MAG: glycosyltransferase family 4 protein [Bacteroidales bacterium]|nr:glycosyltransferase family 4 protein [Bacteroidales bacterium]
MQLQNTNKQLNSAKEKEPPIICFLADTHNFLDDRVYWKEAVSLKNNGYAVYYIFADTTNESGVTDEGIYYFKINSSFFQKKWYLNFPFKILIPGGFYLRMFEKAASLKADVYHIHDLKVNKIGKRLKSLPHKPKIIYDVHEPYPENIRDYISTKGIFTFLKNIYSNYIEKWERNCAKNYDLIITTEENIQERFRKFMPQNKVEIIYNYTNLERTRERLNFEDKIYDAIYSGGITRLRGAFKILEAVKIVAKQKGNFKMLFLGSYFPDDFKIEMQEFIEENGLQENIILHDSVPYNEVPDFYNKSKIGLGIFLPIRTHRIILQIKIFEYMNFGLPIVGSNFGHINDYIKKDKVGIVVNPEDPKEIANALLKILNGPDLFDKCSKNGINAVDNKYRWEFMEKKLIRIYSDLLS